MRIADHIGRVLGGRYRLAAVIGTGASAHVFLADDSRLGRRVAVKILHPALADDAAFLRRFRAEARAAAALSHPNVLAVYDWGEEEDGPFIVTEFLGGGSLRAMLDRGHRLTPSQALLVGLEAARGLDYAHRRGLVHRDIKPANLLFDDDGRLRIADFGLARALAEAAWTEPSGAVLGTARYAAPEQVKGVPLDGKADVYALAVVLVEAVTGRVPFAADTTVGTILGRLQRPLDVPDDLGPMAPIVAKAGKPEPEERPDAMAFGAALHGLASKMPSPEPLPLAGPAIFDEAEVVLDRDPTEMGAGPSPADAPPAGEAVPAATPTAAGGDPTLADASIPPAAPVPETATVPLSKDGRRRRRWPRVALALIVALICSAVAAVALVKAQTPTHPVPLVQDKPVEVATRQMKALGFEVVTKPQFDDNHQKGTVLAQSPALNTRLKEGQTVTLTVADGPFPVEIPDLTGMTKEEALAALEKAVLKVGNVANEYSEDVGAGVVLGWDPKGPAHHGDTVNLVVSLGAEPRTLPDLTKLTYDQAAAKLKELGLNPTRDERYDDSIPAGVIIGTRPPVGTEVERGASVTIVLSRGQPVVPAILGMNTTQAKAALEAVGLRMGQVFGISGTIFASSPDPGSKVSTNTAVNVFIR